MLSKIAGFELRMYFMPGAYCLILISILVRVVTGVDFFNLSFQGHDLTQSFAFIMASYVLGHLIQSVVRGFWILGKRRGPEQRLKNRYWDGYFPSERALFSDSSILGDINRQRVLEALVSAGHMDMTQRKDFESTFSNRASKLAQAIFARLFARAGEKEDSQVKVAEAMYQMFRGFFFSSWLALSLAIVTAIYAKVAHLVEGLPRLEKLSWPGLAAYILFCLASWLVFRYRCRGAAEGFARRVWLTALTP